MGLSEGYWAGLGLGLTADLDFLHHFVGVVLDLHFDGDDLSMVINLSTTETVITGTARRWTPGATVTSGQNEGSLLTSLSREASRRTGLSDIMKLLQISAFCPAPVLSGANWILRITRRAVSLPEEAHHSIISPR